MLENVWKMLKPPKHSPTHRMFVPYMVMEDMEDKADRVVDKNNALPPLEKN